MYKASFVITELSLVFGGILGAHFTQKVEGMLVLIVCIGLAAWFWYRQQNLEISKITVTELDLMNSMDNTASKLSYAIVEHSKPRVRTRLGTGDDELNARIERTGEDLPNYYYENW